MPEETIDVFPMICGSGKVYSLHLSWSTYQAVTTQKSGKYFYTVKWQQWEEWFLDESGSEPVICRTVDTSPGSDEMYQLVDPNRIIGSAWIKRYMKIGEVFRRVPTVIFYDKATGREKRRSSITDYIKLAEFFPVWGSPSGFKVTNVIRLEWYTDAALTQLQETYWYAKDLGLVAWSGRINNMPHRSYIEGIFNNPVPILVREKVNWWHPADDPTIPVNLPEHPETPPAQSEKRTVRNDIVGAKVRKGPSTATEVLRIVGPGTAVAVLTLEESEPWDGYFWAKLENAGYIREDLLEDYEAPLPPVSKFARPFANARIHQGHGAHLGWDLIVESPGITPGTPVMASALGRVAIVYDCTRCLPGKQSFLDAGITLGDPVAMADIGWGFGYGNCVVVEHRYRDLPDDTRAVMDRMNLKDGFLYLIYGHMSEHYCKVGDCVDSRTVLGLVGNSGNSSGPHLHLEPRVSAKQIRNSIFGLQVVNPNVIFA